MMRSPTRSSGAPAAASNPAVVYLAASVSAVAAATVGARVALAIADRVRPTPFQTLRAEGFTMVAAWIALPGLIAALASAFEALRERRLDGRAVARAAGWGAAVALLQWGLAAVMDPMSRLGPTGVLAEVFLLPALVWRGAAFLRRRGRR